MLTRILRERRMEDSRLGRMAIACAAVDDVAAWVLLAGILASVRGHPRSVAITFLSLGVYCAVVWFGLRKFGGGWVSKSLERVLLAIFVASMATEWIGVHAFFGAFVMGVALPKSGPDTEMQSRRIEPLTSALFLPLFFTRPGFAHVWDPCKAGACGPCVW